jgi:hypothetical protein
MNPRVISVSAIENFKLDLGFSNGEQREFDVTPYLEIGIFRELRDPKYFSLVRVSLGTVEWPNGQDFCPDTLYGFSIAYA